MSPDSGIIVSGSNGRIGDAVMRRFAGRFEDVVGFDRKAPQPAPPGCVYVSVDITSDESVRDGLRTIRDHHGTHVASVIHLAAYYDFFGKPSPNYEGDHLHLLAAASADERVCLVDPGDQPGPGGRTASAGRLGAGLLRLGLVALTSAPDTVGVVAVEEGAVLSGVRDVGAHMGQPLERVEGLEVTPQGGIHAGAVEDGLLAVEVDELLQGEGVSDKVGAGVLEVLAADGVDVMVDVHDAVTPTPVISHAILSHDPTTPRPSPMASSSLPRTTRRSMAG